MTHTPPQIPQLRNMQETTRWAATLKTVLDRWFQSFVRGDIEVQGSLISLAGRKIAIRLVTTTPATILKTDDLVDVNVGAPVALTLPANPVFGERHQVQDSSGNAAVNNITVSAASGNINGSPTFVISTNYRRVVFHYNNTQWIAA